MAIPASVALWLLPFALPICFYVAFTDLREMKIKNHAVYALVVVFVVVGLIALPPWSGDWQRGGIGPFDVTLPVYGWQLLHLPVMLFLGVLLNAGGAMGAGDAKFIAAAAPYVWIGDVALVIGLLMASLLAAFVAHRIGKHSALRRLVPDWKSWDTGKKFPMGLALGGCLATYLGMGVFLGS